VGLKSSVLVPSGPLGWAFTKIQPTSHAKIYEIVADMLDLGLVDDLLDVGCGPGAFLAERAPHVRSVTGLEASRIMYQEAAKRLADPIAAGTAKLVLGDGAELPFADEQFSAAALITVPIRDYAKGLRELYRVLRPGGRIVNVDELSADPRRESSARVGPAPWRWDEAQTRRVIQEAGFVDLSVRYHGVWHLVDNRLTLGHKPANA